MSDLVIHWPDEAGEKIRAARGRLALAFETLEKIPFEERLERVADLDRIGRPGALDRVDEQGVRGVVRQPEAPLEFEEGVAPPLVLPDWVPKSR